MSDKLKEMRHQLFELRTQIFLEMDAKKKSDLILKSEKLLKEYKQNVLLDKMNESKKERGKWLIFVKMKN